MSERPRPCKRKPMTAATDGAAAVGDAGAAVAGAADSAAEALGTKSRPCKRKITEEPAGVPPPPPADNSSNGAEENIDLSENDDAATDGGNTEPIGPSKVAAMYDPTLPHLLRIGEDATSEIIELDKQKFLSRGNFNTHGIGSGIRELENLYGVRTQAQIAAMQRAFGVNTMLEQPPLQKYLTQDCKFEGFDLVVLALQTRQRNLLQALTLDSKSQKALRNKHHFEWVSKTIQDMNKVDRDCTAANLEVIRPTRVKKSVVVAPVKGGEGVPCLEDATLLRDLVYLLAMLQGVASPAVRKKLNAIPLQNILDMAAKRNIEGARGKLQIALDALRSGMEATGDAEPSGEFKALLAEIYRMFHGAAAAVPSTLSADDVLDMIAFEIQRRGAMLEELLRMHELEEEVERLEDELETFREGSDSAQMALQDTIDELTRRIAECETAGSARAAELAGMTRAKEAAEQALAQLGGEHDDLQQAKEALDAQVATLTAEVAAKDRRIAELETELANTNASLAAIRRALAEGSATARTEIRNLEARLATLTDERDEARRERDEARRERAALDTIIAGLNTSLEALRRQLEELRVASETTARDLNGRIDAITHEKDALQIQVNDLTDRLAAAQAEADARRTALETAGAEHTAAQQQTADAHAAEIARITAELEAARAELAAANERLAALQAEKDAAEARAGAAETRATNAQDRVEAAGRTIDGIRADLATAQAELAALRSANENAEAQIRAAAEADRTATAAHEAELARLNEQIRALTGRAARAEASAAVKQTQIDTKNTELAAARQDLEECNEASAAATLNHNQALATLRDQVAAARAALQDLQTQTAAGRAGAEAAQEAAQRRIESLEAELEAKKASGSAQQTQFNALRDSLQARIAALEAQVAQHPAQVAAAAQEAAVAARANAQRTADEQLAARNATHEAALEALRGEKGASNTRVGELEAALEALRGQKGASNTRVGELEAALDSQRRKKEASDRVVATRIQTLESQLAELRAGKATSNTAATEASTRAQALQAELEALRSAKGVSNAAAADATARIAALEAELITLRDKTIRETLAQHEGNVAVALGEKNVRIRQLEEALASAQAAAQAATAEKEFTKSSTAGAIQQQRQHIAKQLAQIGELQRAAAAQAEDIRRTQEATSERVQQLLSMILLDPGMVAQANKFLGGDDAAGAALEAETCDFFHYLYTVVNLQLARIRASTNVLPDSLKRNIFEMFNLPAVVYTDDALLKELTRMLQEVMKAYRKPSGTNIRFPVLEGYPILYALFGTADFTPFNKRIVLNPRGIYLELLQLSFFKNVGIRASDRGAFTVEKGSEEKFVTRDKVTAVTLMSVFVIKYIQLLHAVLRKKITAMGGKCGFGGGAVGGGAAAAGGGAAGTELDDDFLSVPEDDTESVIEAVEEDAAAAAAAAAAMALGGGAAAAGGGGGATEPGVLTPEQIQAAIEKALRDAEAARAAQEATKKADGEAAAAGLASGRGTSQITLQILNYVDALKHIVQGRSSNEKSSILKGQIAYLQALYDTLSTNKPTLLAIKPAGLTYKNKQSYGEVIPLIIRDANIQVAKLIDMEDSMIRATTHAKLKAQKPQPVPASRGAALAAMGQSVKRIGVAPTQVRKPGQK